MGIRHFEKLKGVRQMLNKVEIEILMLLHKEGLNNPMDSRTIRNISRNINITYFRVRNFIMNLESLQLVELGFKEQNSRCYFISKKGLETIEKIG